MDRSILCLILALSACDQAPEDLGALRGGSEPVRTNGDPCWDAPSNPGITLTSDEVAIADLCISELPDVDGCWIALGDAPGSVEIWCDFACGETVDTVAVYPAVGAVRVEFVNPCGQEL